MLKITNFLVAVVLSTVASAQSQDNPNNFGGAKPIHPESWVTDADYPPTAKRAHKQGLVQFAFDINLQGRAENCHVTRSSGDDDLDAVTCQLILKRGRFELPKDASGSPYPTKARSQVIWIL